jgi:acetyl-CoA carboxylase biotin carboxyl carrier protein
MDIYKKIKELVEMMQEADLDEIEIKDGLREIRLTKRSPAVMSEPVSVVSAPIQAAPPASAADAAVPQANQAGPPARDENIIEFKSPMVGTFYRAPSPEAPPYVTEGEKVTKDQTICIIEAMKVMNEIKAEEDCEVVDILVENGEAVEFGQPLCLIRVEK